MGLENRAPKARRVENAEPPAVTEGNAANDSQGFTAEEEAWFQQGEARTKAAEAEAKRRAEVAAYNEREAKIKALKEQM